MESFGFFYVSSILLSVINLGIAIACFANRNKRKRSDGLSWASIGVTMIAVVLTATAEYFLSIDGAGDLTFLWAPVFFSFAVSAVVRWLRIRGDVGTANANKIQR